MTFRTTSLGLSVALVCGCGAMGSDASSRHSEAPPPSADEDHAGAGVPCGDSVCQAGFVCEFGSCVFANPPLPPQAGETRDPLSSERYVFSLDAPSQRLVRIDSLTLSAQAYAAGLLPMDLGVMGNRDLTVILDGFDWIELLDHRQDPPARAGWTTARHLSHVRLSPSGHHAVAYYDWDDPRAKQRQPEPGNINKVSVLYTGDTDEGFVDDQDRIVDISVGFLPRDVRFAADGTRAVIVSESNLTPIALFEDATMVAQPEAQVAVGANASKILIDSQAAFAAVLYPGSAILDVLTLATGERRCFEAPGTVTDMAFKDAQNLVIQWLNGAEHAIALVSVESATADCTAVAMHLLVGAATRIALDSSGDWALAYRPHLDVKSIWQVNLDATSVHHVALEKSVAAVAFVGDGRFALISHLKAPGTPAWDPTVEHPEVSVDKSFGASWLDMQTRTHHLMVSNEPLGEFVFVPGSDSTPSATYQAVLDARAPQLLRISHALGFAERWLDLAAMPLHLGFLPETSRAFATQEHPWGRITFIDPAGSELRHVTGFALEMP